MNSDTTLLDDEDRFADLVEAMVQATAVGLPNTLGASVEVPAAIAVRLEGLPDLVEQLHRRCSPKRPAALQGLRHLKHYQIRDLLGQGGFGLVFLAVDTKLNREVAVKLPLRRPAPGPRPAEGFVAEAKAMAQLKHPHLVTVYERDEAEGMCFIVSEYCPAGSLAGWLAKRIAPVPLRAAVRLIQVLAEALQYMHKRGVLHRDLKPANILFSDEGKNVPGSAMAATWSIWEPGPDGEWPFVPKISDFGLAKNREAVAKGARCLAAGTAGYMAPEQSCGDADAICPATDVYSLGVVLYELLTREKPFDDSNSKSFERQPVPPRKYRKDLDCDLEAVCLKCLVRDPRQRYDSAADLAADLGRWQTGEPVQARSRGLVSRSWRVIWRRRFWIAGALTAALAVVVAAAFWDRAGPADELRQIELLLAQGQPAVLVPEVGRPGWFRWRLRDGILNDPEEQGEQFSIRAGSELCLMELLPDPQSECYQFSAHVLHRGVERNGEVGVYCFYESRAGDKGDQASFAVWTFSDLRRIPPPGGKANTPQRKAVFYLRGFCAPSNEFTVQPLLRSAPLHAELDEKPSLQWHFLSIKVTPESVECFFDGQCSGRIDRSALLVANRVDLHKAVGFQPEFPCRGGLGLCVRSGLAFFKHVRVEPMPWPAKT